MSIINPEITYTVEEFISSGQATVISYNNLSLLKKLNDINFPILNVIHDYMDDIKNSNLVVTAKLTDLEFIKYQYKPKLLSYDIYGTIDLSFFILALNGLCDYKTFNKKKIKLLRKNDLNQLLTWIYNSEKKFIDGYNNK